MIPHLDLSKSSKKLILRMSYNELNIQKVKGILGHRWNPGEKTWELPFTIENFLYLKKHLVPMDIGPHLLAINNRLEEEEAERSRALIIKKAKGVKINDYKFKTKPYIHQTISFDFLRKLKRGALFLEMGTGKTKVVIDVLAWLLLGGKIEKILYIAPNSTLENIQGEFEKHSPVDFSISIIRGTKKKRLALLDMGSQIDIINYEGLYSVFPKIWSNNYDVVICDESSKIKNPRARRSKLAHKLGERVDYKYILTGTPISQSPIDIFSQYKFLDPTIFGFSYVLFRNEYAVMGGWMAKEIVGYQNMDQLRDKIFQCAIRFTKKDCLDLPEKVYEILRIDMEPNQRKAYEEMRRNLITEVKGKTMSVALLITKLVRLQQITSGFIVADDTGKEISIPNGNAKLREIVELMEEILQESKAVIWCRFIRDIHSLGNIFSGYNPSFLYGAIAPALREKEIKKFQEDPLCRLLIAQPMTGGLGINLTAASYSVHFSNSFSLEERIQAEDRLHRIGQENKVTYVDLVCRGTVDEAILKVLKGKRNLAEILTKDNFADVTEGRCKS